MPVHPLSDPKKEILIVDDSLPMLTVLEHFYQSIGFKVVGKAQDGLEALNFLDMDPVPYVSLDIAMPVMDGIEAYRKIRESFPECQAFFVSILSSEPRVVQAYTGVIASELFLPKIPTPGHIENLLAYFRRQALAANLPLPPSVSAA